jgi:teichuronic acid biosynthesis glycosyltransferase TuaG
MRLPLVSVIIPTFNSSKLLEKTLRSVISQSYKNLEIIIIDDGSSDETEFVVNQLMLTDNRIRYIQRSKNSNLPAVARNNGIENCKGEYIAFLDHDDLWVRKKIEREISFLEKYKSVGLVHSCFLTFGTLNPFALLRSIPGLSDRNATAKTLEERNMIICSSVVVRRDLILKLNGFDERLELRAVEDFALWREVVKLAPIIYLPEVHGFYRQSSLGTLASENLTIRWDIVDRTIGSQLSNWKYRRSKFRAIHRILSFPLSIYIHLIEGELRKILNIEPRISKFYKLRALV